MMKAIATSDWHLEGLDKYFGDEGVDIQLQEIDKIYMYAVRKGIKHIFIVGDITHKYLMRDSTKAKLLRFFVKYEGVVDSHYLGGNHDRADSQSTSMDLISSLCEWQFLKSLHIYLQPKQIEVDGIVCNMLPHPSTQHIKSRKPAINFIHTEIEGAVGDNGRPLRVHNDLRIPQRDFVIGGHIHKQQVVSSNRVLCGAPYQLNFGEELPKGFLIFDARYVGNRLKVVHKFINRVPQVVFETKLISEQQEFAELEVNRYKLYRLFCDGVSVPANLRVNVPNVAQIRSSQLPVCEKQVVAAPTLCNPVRGLRKFLEQRNMSATEVKKCGQLLKTALKELGSEDALT